MKTLSVILVAIFAFVPSQIRAESAPAPASSYDLRVFGKLNVKENTANGVRSIRITAESAEKARIVYSKLIGDFTSLPTVKAQTVKSAGTALTALAFDGGRRLLPVLHEKDANLDVFLFDKPEQLDMFLSSAPDTVKGAVTLSRRAHPLFLDLWDARNMGFWYSLGFKAIAKDRTDDQDFDFLRPLQLNVNTVGSGVSAVAQRCDRDDLGYKTNRWYDVSNYAYDAHPEASNKSDPDMTYFPDYYGDVPLADNPILRGQAADLLSYLGQFTDDEHLMTITDAYGETAARTTHAYPGFAGRDEPSRQDFVHYLRDIRKMSLPELGLRWYGDSKRFASWDAVKFPREREFYGWEDGKSQDLAGTWRWKKLNREQGEKELVFSSGYDDSKWLAYRQPGTQYLSGATENGAWMRYSFTPDSKLLKAGTSVYLTVCPFNNAPYTSPSTVYLNGNKIADMTFGHGLEWGQTDVTKMLKPDANVIALYTPAGKIAGPVFLTLRKAEDSFPGSDPGLNARRFDVREWVADDCARAVALSVKRLRGIDPERGVKLMAPHDNVDLVMPYMAEWGVYPHCTGQGAYFRPWLRRNGYLHGIMGSSETSQSASDVHKLMRVFFTFTFEGMGAHDYFYNLHDILVSPEKKDWYEKNLPYLKLTGRFDLRKPDVAIAWSLRADRYGVKNGSCYQNDPGRGDLQQAHFSFVYCSEKDILDGRADSYKILIDDNFTTVEPQEIEALEAWVRKGGMLVLNQRSGRNTILQPNAWPINRLTGCEPAVRPQEGTVTFEKNPSILRSYAGRSFKNYGEPIDWQKINYFGDSVALQPKADGIEVLARYEDGKPAVVVRSLGAGKVVMLGSAFYRKSTDVKGFWMGSPEQTAFYKTLLSDLGASPVVESEQSALWAERFIANNGSTEMLVLGNQRDTDTLKDAAAVWNLGFAPRRVFDPATGADLKVKIDGTKVHIGNITLAPYEMRYFGVERTDMDAAKTVAHWLGRQTQLWHALPAGEKPSKPDVSWPIFVQGKFEVKQFEAEAEARKAMAVGFTPGNDWQSMLVSDWASAGLKRGSNLWAVYRKTIDIDPEWLKDLRGVEYVQTSTRAWMNNLRDMTVNGLPILDQGKPVNGDKILSALKPGKNELALLSVGGKDGNGGFYGEFGFRRIPGASGKVMDISSGWTVYPSEIDPQSANFPAKGEWLMARRNVNIPVEFKGSEVWLEIDGTASAIATNGRLRYVSNNYGAKISPRPYLVNITPDIRFGEDNEIAFGNGKWMERVQKYSVDVRSAKLILVPKN